MSTPSPAPRVEHEETLDPAPPSTDLWALQDSRWLSNVLRPLLIAAMSTAVVMGPIAVGRLITGYERFYALMPLFALVALQAVYSRLWLAHPTRRWYRDLRMQISEIVIWLIILRFITWYIRGQTFNINLLRQWFLEPLTFFDNLFIYSALLILATWKFASGFITIFIDLGFSTDELIDYRASGQERAWIQAIPTNREAMVEQFAQLWMWGGVVLVLTATMAGVTFRPEPGTWIGLRTLGLSNEIIVALLVYFLGGLILLSQARLAVLRVRWHREGSPGIFRATSTWQRYSIAIILGVALLVSLLPFGSTFGLAYILQAIIQIVVMIYVGVMALLVLLISLILSLFGVDTEVPAPAPEPIPTPAPPAALPAADLIPAWFSGSAFWLLLIGLVVYLLYLFFRRRGVSFAMGRTWWHRFSQWWRRFFRQVQIRVEGIRIANWRRKIPTQLSRPQAPWRFIRLSQLSPAEKIRYYYLSTLQRAGDRGVRRQGSQTPLEYERSLMETWPEMHEDFHILTSEFLAARYTTRPIETQEEKRVRVLWKSLKKALQARRRSSPKAPPPGGEEEPGSAGADSPPL